MKAAFFDTRGYDRSSFQTANADFGHELTFFEPRLTAQTVALARGFPVICAFVNDQLNAEVLETLQANGTGLIALRCTGFNNLDLAAAQRLKMSVVRVTAYSPHAVAEHAVAMLLALNRKIVRAASRIREMNFSLEGLEGFDLHGKTVGVIGTGKIGRTFANIMLGFGCQILAHDPFPSPLLQSDPRVRYTDPRTIAANADIISLHVPLTPETRHMLNAHTFQLLKPGAIIINTSRGGLIDTRALIAALKSKKIAGAALDVYEEEAGIFFNDRSHEGIQDDVLARLTTFPNVLITSHQAFLTREALNDIARTTLESITAFERGEPLQHQVTTGS